MVILAYPCFFIHTYSVKSLLKLSCVHATVGPWDSKGASVLVKASQVDGQVTEDYRSPIKCQGREKLGEVCQNMLKLFFSFASPVRP